MLFLCVDGNMRLVQLRKDDDGYHLHLHPGEMFFPTVEEFDAYLDRVDDVVEVRTVTSTNLIFTYPPFISRHRRAANLPREV